MKRLGLLLLMVLFGITLLGCNELGLTTIDPTNLPTDEVTTYQPTTNMPTETEISEEVTYEDRMLVGSNEGCNDSDNSIFVGGECIYMEDILSSQINVTESQINVTYENGIEVMDDLIADLSGSTGLAVVPREVYVNQRDLNQQRRSSLMNVSVTLEDEVTNNLIVKLTEDGFFEEVSFTDSTGYTVNINSNPLALEVFGDYTVIIFEVDFGYPNDQRNFDQRLFDSLYSGGIYLIHNDTGKLFPTSDVEFVEDTWTETNYEYETIITTANVNEPVTQEVISYLYDEFGDPILDEFGEPTFEMVDEIILDEFGNEIIFEEGPIVTETQQFPVTETFLVLVTDDQGEPVLDEFGQPVYDEVIEPVLDELGEPVYYEEQVPVLDEFGEMTYQTDFEVEILVKVEVETTHTVYRAAIQQGPLYELSRRFVERVLDNYFNWNFYRMNNYSINYGFAESGDMLYYIDDKYNDVTDTNERYIMRLSFDEENTELVLEEIMNITKAGFTQGDLIIDPHTNIILYKNYAEQANIKAYSPTLGLKIIPDSDNFEIRIFPNDELFLVDRELHYVDVLGYDTTVIYSLNEDASLTAHYIELGVRDELSTDGIYSYGFQGNIIDQDGNPISDNENNYYIDIQIGEGEKIIETANLKILSIDGVNASRPECVNEDGCQVFVQYDFYIGENYLGSGYRTHWYYPGDTPPPFQLSYQLQENTTINYATQWLQVETVCSNEEVGCNNRITLFDQMVNQDYSLETNVIVGFGEKLIAEFIVKEDNNVQYEYSKTDYSNTCEFEECQARVKLEIYDLSNNLISSEWHDQTYLQDEQIPLIIEYRMSENSTITEGSVCSNSGGCDRSFYTPENLWYWIRFDYGQRILENIEFVATDRSKIYEKTYDRQTCSNIDGCYQEDVNYLINDDQGNLLYEFSQNLWVPFGSKAPYIATLTLDDVVMNYRTTGSDVQKYCEEATCNENVTIFFKNANEDEEYIANMVMKYIQGEQIINDFIIDATTATPFEIFENRICTNEQGCYSSTMNYTILDENGNELTIDENWTHYLSYKYKFGDEVSVDQQFSVTYELADIVYRTRRVEPYYIFDFMENFTVLDDNMFYIKSPSWAQGIANYILTYDEEDDTYYAAYTNLPYMYEIEKLGDGYVGINNDKTAIYYFELDTENSTVDDYQYILTNLTENQEINAVSNLIIDYDGSIYFEAVDDFIQDITGKIADDGTITIDTVFTEYEIVRVRPIN